MLRVRIITGPISGVVVIDVDVGPGKSGADTIAKLQVAHEDLPETLTCKTGGGGLHYYFQWPDAAMKTGRDIVGPGVDVRGDGGFIVAPPTKHPSGRHYTWLDPEALVADMPNWLGTLIQQSTTPSRNAFGRRTDGREDFMTRLVWRHVVALRRDSPIPVPAEAIFDELWPEYERECKARGDSLEADGRGPSELRRKIAYALNQWHTKVAEATQIAEQRATPPLIAWSKIRGQPVRDYLIKDLLDRGGFSVIFGKPGCGKSFLALSISAHVAIGRPWRDRRIRQGKVIYIAAEGGTGVVERLKAFEIVEQSQPHSDLLILPQFVNLRDPTEDVEGIIQAIEALGGEVELIVVDTLSRTFAGGNENAPSDMGAFITTIDILRQKTGAHVMVIHHAGKDETRGARGHTSLMAAADTHIEVRKTDDLVIAEVKRQREGADGDEFVGELESVQVGTDSDGDPVWSAALVASDRDPGKKCLSLTGHSRTAFVALEELIDSVGEYPPASNHIPNGTRCVTRELWEAQFLKEYIGDRKSGTRTFRRVSAKLKQSGIAGSWDPHVWIV